MQHRFAGLFLFLLKLFFTEIQGSQFPFPLGGGGGNGNSKGLINEGQTVDYPSGVPAKNCTEACLIKRQNTKNSRIEKIKLQILKGLKDSDEGFTGREDHPRLWVNNYTATTADPEEDVLEFHLEPVPPGAAPPRVTQAKLFVLIRWRKPPGKRNKKNANKKNKNKRKNRKERITLKIYKVNDTSEVPKQQRIADLRVMMHHTKWQKLIIPTWVVQDAFDSADHRLLLRVVCEECGRYGNSGPKPVLFYRKKQRKRSNKKIKVQGIKTVGEPVSRDRRQDPSVRASKVHKRGPFLQIRTRQRSQRRVRRGAAEEDSTCTAATVRDVTTDVPCGISSMYVDFTEFGWDWIISPKYFYTNFCFGTCSAENWSENEGKVSENQYNRDISNSDEDNGQMTQNANFVESVDDTRRCCRAVETQPLTLQYYTETGNVKSRQIENLIVTKCGCY